jgi:hypothetical protein
MAVTLTVSPSPETDDEEPPEFFAILETSRSQRNVDATVSVQIVVEEGGEEEFEIEDFRIVPRTPQPNVLITKQNGETIRIQGTYFDPFDDIFRYVEKGSSDKIENPITVVGVSNLPPNKDYFDLNQDVRQVDTIFYDVFVDIKDKMTEEITTEQLEITHDILNEFEGLRIFVTEYYG